MAEGRFTRYETQALPAVSDVQTPQPNPFETKRKNAPHGARFGIRYWAVAVDTTYQLLFLEKPVKTQRKPAINRAVSFS